MENLLIIKTIYKIHSSVYLLAFFSIITASFIEFIIIMSLIMIHELGHYISARLLKEEVKNIMIYPFGGITKINMEINESFKKELIILSMGPIFQIIGCILLTGIIPQKKEMIMIYHNGILLFNLLPIYPLDGGKLLKLGLDFLCPYKKSFRIIIMISYSVLIILFITREVNINIIYTIIFLVFLIRKEQKKEPIYYEKLLLEKYLKKKKYKRIAIIESEKDFYKRRNHLIKKNKKYFSENEYLWKKYRNFMKSY